MTPVPDPNLGPEPDPDRLVETPVAVHRPVDQAAPIVVASPHSGRAYPADFVAQSRLDSTMLRHSEDAYVDALFADAPELGVPLVRALFPRALVDANREPLELDPAMFSDSLPAGAVTHSPRVAAGLGTIPRVVTNGEPIFERRLSFAEVGWRIDAFRTPYHDALQTLMNETVRRFGAVFVIDAHSMPSLSGAQPTDGGPAGRGSRIDIVLGDGHGTTCHPILVGAAETALAGQGLRVVRNAPYAGGYTTRHYGRPETGVHVLQVEINRALYLDEARVEPTAGFDALRRTIAGFLDAMIGAVDPIVLRPDVAAE